MNDSLITVSNQYSGRLSDNSNTIKTRVLEKESYSAGQGTLQELQEDERRGEEEVPGGGEAEQEGEEEDRGRGAVRGARAEVEGALHHWGRLGGPREGGSPGHSGELRQYHYTDDGVNGSLMRSFSFLAWLLLFEMSFSSNNGQDLLLRYTKLPDVFLIIQC